MRTLSGVQEGERCRKNRELTCIEGVSTHVKYSYLILQSSKKGVLYLNLQFENRGTRSGTCFPTFSLSDPLGKHIFTAQLGK